MTTRDRQDRCPGLFRPWAADDGLLVRLRLVGGRLPAPMLRQLVAIADAHGDGRVRTTNRGNLQLRALPAEPGSNSPRQDVVDAILATGISPSAAHDLVRNILVSPQTGLADGLADLRPVADRLDALLRESATLATLPGKFLFVLDDGRGDLVEHWCDLGLVVLPGEHGPDAQLRIGDEFGAVVPLEQAADELALLAEAFVAARTTQVLDAPQTAAWHVTELDQPFTATHPRDPRVPAAIAPLPFGEVPGGRHVELGTEGIDAAMLDELLCPVDGVDTVPGLVVTPWYGVLVPAK